MSIKASSAATPISASPPSLPGTFPRKFDPALPKPRRLRKANFPLENGLTTPPADDMSATYPAMPLYDGHSLQSYPPALPHAGRMKPIMDDARSSRKCRYNASQQVQLQDGHYPAASQMPIAMLSQTNHLTTPTTNSSALSKHPPSHSRRSSESLIYHSLQLPRCISPSSGSLPDFAAQMTCLFWFESLDELKIAETIQLRSPHSSIARLPSLAKPHDQFQKWVYNVLSTTQVTQNVILLALLFIYRLKMSTPQIKGRAGSEYRLLTVALMLGNKFLDDNTYTNKTWAEVSCFAVHEIHVMEVEFLSNMRYNLSASKEEWEQWIVKLSCFHEYYDRASRLPVSPVHMSPPAQAVLSPIPSPSAASMPSFIPSAKSSLSPSSRHSHNVFAYQTNATSPLASKVPIPAPSSRKRSHDGDFAEHPAKRQLHQASGHHQSIGAAPSVRLGGPQDRARLPFPPLSLVTNQPYESGSAYQTQNSGSNQQVVSLPPIQPNVRAMSTVYQPSSASAGLMQPQSVGPSTAGTAMPAASYSVAPALQTQTPMGYGTPTKHHSPGRLVPGYASSPLVEPYGPISSTHTPVVHTPISNSPSVYLQHRASPYKPIRHVNRLLYPPPSASLEQYHLSVPVQPNQMHYQPLGRRNDLRQGIVPEFMTYERGQQQQQQQLPPHRMQQGHAPS